MRYKPQGLRRLTHERDALRKFSHMRPRNGQCMAQVQPHVAPQRSMHCASSATHVAPQRSLLVVHGGDSF